MSLKDNILKSKIKRNQYSYYGDVIDIKLTNDGYVNCLYSNGICSLFKDEVVLTKNPQCIHRHYSVDEKSIIMICKNPLDIRTNPSYSFEKWENGGNRLEVFFEFFNQKILLVDFSIDCNFIVFTEYTSVKLCNLKSLEIKNIYISKKNKINCVKISKDNSIVVFSTGTELLIFNIHTEETKTINYSKYTTFFALDIYIDKDLSIKLGFKNGTILLIKNDIISVIRNHSKIIFENCKFSPSGEMLILDNKFKQIKFIHEKGCSEYDIISENIYFDCFTFSSDSKLLIIGCENYIYIYDISHIGNLRRNQISTFLTILEKEKSDTLSELKNNCLFDINVTNLIFNFLPICTENLNLKQLQS